MKKPIIRGKRIKPSRPKKKPTQKRWDAIIKRIGTGKGIVGAEIGVDMGKTCKVLFERVPGIFLYLVDRWIETPQGDSYFKGSKKLAHEPQSYFDKAYKTVKEIAKPYNHKILKMDSVEAAKHVKDKSLDVCFIDGDHSEEGTERDNIAWLPKVKVGGWICGHDYDNQNTIGNVKKAVDRLYGKDIELDVNTTWFHKVTEKDHKRFKEMNEIKIEEIEETETEQEELEGEFE